MGMFLIEESLRKGGVNYRGLAHVVDGSDMGIGILKVFSFADIRRGADMLKVETLALAKTRLHFRICQYVHVSICHVGWSTAQSDGDTTESRCLLTREVYVFTLVFC